MTNKASGEVVSRQVKIGVEDSSVTNVVRIVLQAAAVKTSDPPSLRQPANTSTIVVDLENRLQHASIFIFKLHDLTQHQSSLHMITSSFKVSTSYIYPILSWTLDSPVALI